MEHLVVKNHYGKGCLLSLIFLCLLFTGCRENKQENKVSTLRTKSGIEMVKILAGLFEMGNDRGQTDEKPVHKVWIDTFLMDRFEVTQKQFKNLKISDPSHFKDPNNPAEQVTWQTAIVFCNKRSRYEGLEPCYDEQTLKCNFDANGYRLPTEAEWEYAARAGTKSEYFFGSNSRLLDEYGWFSENSGKKTHNVGGKKANAWGLYDIYGNVSEWCNDFYSADFYKTSPEKNPKGPSQGKERVIRGGAWNSSAKSCRSSYRASSISLNDTCLADDAIGFRCVRKITEEEFVRLIAMPEYKEEKKTGLVYDDLYLRHKTGENFPERPQRLTAIIEQLKKDNIYSKLTLIKPSPAEMERLTAVHSPQYTELVKESCEKGKTSLAADVQITRDSYDTAVLAAGGVIDAVDEVMKGAVRNAFCAVRPPGHHASIDSTMGFCIFNNVAIAAKYIQKRYNLSRILIVDWDVHHGNGTQSIIYDDPNIMYFSVHQANFYPFTGDANDKMKRKFIINVPLPAGSADADYKKAFDEKLLPAALSFDPDFVLISAGFDAAKGDTIGQMALTPGGFAELTEIVKSLAERCCSGRLVSILEGGYNIQVLPKAVEAHIKALMD